MVTTTTSKRLDGEDEYPNVNYLDRKQELRELQLLQKQEQKQCQDLNLRAHLTQEAQVTLLEFINIICLWKFLANNCISFT